MDVSDTMTGLGAIGGGVGTRHASPVISAVRRLLRLHVGLVLPSVIHWVGAAVLPCEEDPVTP